MSMQVHCIKENNKMRKGEKKDISKMKQKLMIFPDSRGGSVAITFGEFERLLKEGELKVSNIMLGDFVDISISKFKSKENANGNSK